MVTDALGHMMNGYTFVVPMNQRLLNKSSKEHNKTGGGNSRQIPLSKMIPVGTRNM